MPPRGAGLQVQGCLIRVPDLDIAESFYHGQLGFEPVERHSGFIRLRATPDLFLEEVPIGPNPAYGQARVSLTLQVENLAAASDRLLSHGIPLVTGRANLLPIGLVDCFCDPFGNVHTLLQPHVSPPRDFQIHSIGLKTPIGLMPAARYIYENLLGFKALTERYYPPTLPLGNVDGSLAFVIHDKHPWEADLRARAPLYPNDMGAVLVFRTTDASAGRERLAIPGRLRATQVEEFVLGYRFGIVDNAGIPSEIWELR